MSTSKTRHYKIKMLPKNIKRDSVSAYVYIRRDTPCTQLYATVSILDESPSLQQLHTYLIDGPFLNQKTYKDIRISYSLKFIRKNKFLYENNNGSVRCNKNSG